MRTTLETGAQTIAQSAAHEVAPETAQLPETAPAGAQTVSAETAQVFIQHICDHSLSCFFLLSLVLLPLLQLVLTVRRVREAIHYIYIYIYIHIYMVNTYESKRSLRVHVPYYSVLGP